MLLYLKENVNRYIENIENRYIENIEIYIYIPILTIILTKMNRQSSFVGFPTAGILPFFCYSKLGIAQLECIPRFF